MKKWVGILSLSIIAASVQPAKAQSQEAQQLLLNVEKLAQLKQILSDLKKGYEIVSKGYTAIKNISEGNFNLHKTFLDALLEVSPAVRNYKKVTDIITMQRKIVTEYKAAFKRFQSDQNFAPDEINYLGKVYANLFQQSLKNLDALARIITAGKLRMSDDERLEAIDTIFADMQDKLVFLRHFNNNTTILAVQRAKERNNIATLKNIYGINQ